MKKDRIKLILKTSLVGIVANLFLVVFKAIIGWLSHSIAITLDAINNLTDAVSSIITIVGIRLAGKDPDKEHPFGHGRTEYISTLAIGVIILYAGVTAGIESVKNIINPKESEYSIVMLIVIGVAVLVKVFLGTFFIKKGKDTKSDSLQASGKDALFDAVISVATIVAAVVYMIWGLSLEAYLGVIISGFIIKAGFEILKETVSKILGERESVELVRNIKRTIVEHEGVMGAYDLIFNNYGQDVSFASVHIEVVENLSASEIDVLTRHITQDIIEEYGVYLTAIGIYAYNTTNDRIIAMREIVERIATSHQYVNQIHGFYVNLEEKVIRFDMVISFDAPSRAELYEHVMNDLKEEYPDFEISAGMDADFNEI